MNRRTLFGLVALLGMIVGCTTPLIDTDLHVAKTLDADPRKDDRGELQSKVPTGARLYVFFIGTSEAATKAGADPTIDEMRRQFYAFGKSIGQSNTAIWVNERGSNRLSARHGKYLADRYRLHADAEFDYNKGPYIVVTDMHPVLAFESELELLKKTNPASPRAFVFSISLNGVSPPNVIEGMNTLEQYVRRNEITSKSAAELEFWLKFDSWLRSNKDAIAKTLEQVWTTALVVVAKAK